MIFEHLHDDLSHKKQRRCFEACYFQFNADADAAASICIALWLNEKQIVLKEVSGVNEVIHEFRSMYSLMITPGPHSLNPFET